VKVFDDFSAFGDGISVGWMTEDHEKSLVNHICWNHKLNLQPRSLNIYRKSQGVERSCIETKEAGTQGLK